MIADEDLERAFAKAGFADAASQAKQVTLLSAWAIRCAGRESAAAYLQAEAVAARRAVRKAREGRAGVADAALPWVAYEALCRAAAKNMASKRPVGAGSPVRLCVG